MSNILIIDDEPANRELIRTLLSYDGHHVTAAANGEDAIALLDGEAPDLIIVDLHLPGMSGPELIKRLRTDERLAKARIALYTSTEADAAMRDFMSLMRIEHVIPKPAEPQDVLAAVRDALA
jgi:CheY-like chemotaxis protein